MGQKDGNFSCNCIDRRDCAKEKDLVCGTDGNTYLNECILKAESCDNKTSVGVKHAGACGTVFCILTLI